MALAHHLMLRLRDDRVLTPSVGARRTFARTVCDIARGSPLLAFSAADTHAHLLVARDRAEAGELARRLEIALVHHLDLPVGFSRAHLRPVEDQRHLENAFHYVLGQHRHHGCSHDPFRETTNLPDLLGLRPRGGFTIELVRGLRPRVTRESLLVHLGLARLEEADGPLSLLREAALAAAARTDFGGRSEEVILCRQAAVHLGLRRERLGPVAELLGLPLRTAQRDRQQEPHPRWVRAVQLQLCLRDRLGAGIEDLPRRVEAAPAR